MTTKHTPGPWSIKPSDRGVTVEAGDQFEIARCPGDKQGRIDAHLIAAAPELLEALKYILTRTDIRVIYETAEAAIAKAEGSAE